MTTGQLNPPRSSGPAAPPSWLRTWLEPAVAITLSLAGLMTSLASYEATLWTQRQAAKYGLAGAHRTMGSRAALDASTSRAMEVGLFSAWLDAKSAGDERLAKIYADRFPPEFKPAFDEWIAQQPLTNPGAAPSPFRLKSFRQQGQIDAAALDARAETEFSEGRSASNTAAAFTRGAVILAMSMFFGGIGQVFASFRVRIALACMAMLTCILGVAAIFSLPMLTLF